MLLDALSKIKRQSILTAILLMCLGIMLLLCPEEYITTLIILSGYIMIVYALEQTHNLCLSRYVKCAGWLVANH